MASELACTYACLVLHDEGIPVTAEKIATLVKAANIQVESYWPTLFAKLAEKKNMEELILNIGSGGGGGAAVTVPSSAAPAEAASAVEEKKEEVKEESDDENIFSLFDD